MFFGFECLAAGQVDIRFYGKLLDQYNEPVPAAAVHIQVSTTDAANGLKKVTLRTDENGLFELDDTGSSFEIMSIKKKGYEFLNMRKMPVGFKYSAQSQEDIFVPDAANPVTFHTRKKDDSEYLVRAFHRFRFSPDKSRGYSIDLLATNVPLNRALTKKRIEAIRAGITDPNSHPDLKVSAAISEDKSSYDLSITAIDANSAIFVSDVFLCEAPESGYRPSAAISIDIAKKPKPIKKYVYIKARGGTVYSLLVLRPSPTAKELKVPVRSWTNKNGLRDFEYEDIFSNSDPRLAEANRWNFDKQRRQISQEQRGVTRDARNKD